MKTEKIPLAIIYKQNRQIQIELSKDTSIFELYGFLNLYMETLECDLLNSFENTEGKE